MLVLTRKFDEKIRIGDNITITVIEINENNPEYDHMQKILDKYSQRAIILISG